MDSLRLEKVVNAEERQDMSRTTGLDLMGMRQESRDASRYWVGMRKKVGHRSQSQRKVWGRRLMR